MINVSSAFMAELDNDNRNYICDVTITLKSGTILNLGNEELWSGGISIEESVSNDSSFDIGSTIINKATIVINNIYENYTDYDFKGAKAIIKIGLKLSDETVESINKGIFYVDSASYNGSIITLECLDSMSKFDKDYSLSTLEYPASLLQIVQDACDKCDVLYSAARFDNDDFVVEERPEDESLTFRQVLNYVGQIACQQFSIDHNDRLIARWYNRNTIDDLYNNGESDGDYHIISAINSSNIDVDDVVITGVRVTEFSNDSDNSGEVYLSGNEGYVIDVKENKLIHIGFGSEIADYLGNRLVGMRFRPMELTFQNNPTIEPTDAAEVVDYKGNHYYTFVTNTTFTVGNSQTLSCGAESATRNSASRYSASTQAYANSKILIEKERTEREKAIDALNKALSSSSGMYITEEKQDDGSVITYLHDSRVLSESQNIIKITSEAIGISNDGGETYPYGLFLTGDLIARLLYAVGINADYINSGAITVKDQNGEITFFADTVTGRVEIKAQSLTITGKTVQEIAAEQSDSAINDFVDAVYNPGISGLQAQIDGQIETYYYDYEPTLTNEPASEWTTETERQKHEGDLFYWKSKGYAYRFFKDGNTWKWQMVQDTDITKALEQAATAQDTADQKRRVFVATPTPPYDVGDLWTQGTAGDIMRCKTARQSGNYNSADWVKASKYTDDSFAEEVQKELQNLQIGGRNLILNSGFNYNNDPYEYWRFQGTHTKSIDDADQYGKCLTISFSSAGSVSNRFYALAREGIFHVISMEYTLSFYAKAATEGTQIKAGTARLVSDSEFPTFNLTTEWTRYTITYTATTSEALTFFIVQAGAEISIAHPKLEYGNKSTDWTPAPEDTDTYIDDLVTDLQDQLDGKVETWYQSSDPSTAWTTADLKNKHIGDIWYKTSTGKSYRWNETSWQETKSTPPDEVFDEIDGKAQIFISTPKPPYYQGDLWFNSTTSDIMTCIKDRTSGSYTASDWQKRNKYTDDSFAEQVQQELNDLQIGGRNLIPNTNNMSKYPISGGITVITDDEGYSVVNYPATTTLAWRSFATKNNIRYANVRNKQITVSFEYRSDAWTKPASGSGNNYPVLSLDISNVSETSNSRDAYWSYYSSAIGQPTTEWKKFVYTLTVTDKLFTSGTADPTESSWFYARVFNYSLNHMQVRKFKIEIGNRATDWSPAPEDTETYADNLAADLQDQIDGKIETYNQTSDPSTAWTTTALKTQHTGDLWYSSSTKQTKRWSGTAWVTLQNAEAQEAQELAATKAQVFTATPKPPYYAGDLWFNSATSDIMTCIKDRASGSYTASDWQKRNKYTDDSAVYDLDNALDQDGVFNRLTNNGATKGIYMSGNQLYVNASYIKSGTLVLGGTNNGNGTLSLRNASNVEISRFSNNGIEIKNGGYVRAGYTSTSGSSIAELYGGGIRIYKNSNVGVGLSITPVSTGDQAAIFEFWNGIVDYLDFTDFDSSGKGTTKVRYQDGKIRMWANIEFLGDVLRQAQCSVFYNSSNYTIAPSSGTKRTTYWASTIENALGLTYATQSGFRGFTVKKSGWYFINVAIHFTDAGFPQNTALYCYLDRNNVNQSSQIFEANNFKTANYTFLNYADAGDFFSVALLQNSGSNVTVNGTLSRFNIIYVGS